MSEAQIGLLGRGFLENVNQQELSVFRSLNRLLRFNSLFVVLCVSLFLSVVVFLSVLGMTIYL